MVSSHAGRANALTHPKKWCVRWCCRQKHGFRLDRATRNGLGGGKISVFRGTSLTKRPHLAIFTPQDTSPPSHGFPARLPSHLEHAGSHRSCVRLAFRGAHTAGAGTAGHRVSSRIIFIQILQGTTSPRCYQPRAVKIMPSPFC